MRSIATLFLICCCLGLGLGQTQQIYILDFDGNGSYTTSTTEGLNGSSDYFTTTDGSNISASFSGMTFSDGNFFAAQDMDGVVSDSETMTISGITIAGYTNLELRVYIAEDDDGSAQDWDANTEMLINYTIDSGSPNNGIHVQSVGGTNTEPAIDSDFDGTGNSPNITDTWTQYTHSISSTGSSMTITVAFNDLDAGDEDIAIDDIEVWGTPSSTPVVGFVSTTSSVTEGNSGTTNHTVDMELSNYQGSPVDVEITDAGTGSATGSGTDYSFSTQTLTFNSNGTQSINVTIQGDTDDEGDETIDLDLAVTSGTANTGNDTHEVTILDDDTPKILISQYVETSSGTTPKGIEIWNNSGGALDFSQNNLVVEKYTNGSSSPTTEATVSTGTLADNEVLVIGGSALMNHMDNNVPSVMFIEDPFSFNGDDALEILYGGTQVDVFGTIGSDPGSSWDGNGVSTEGQNIQLLGGITSGSTGFSDPSTRFETVVNNVTGFGDLTGFGSAPGGAPLPITLQTLTATPKANTTHLHWRTATELNNDYMAVEHSTDGRRYSEIGRVLGAGTTQEPHDYRFTHEAPAPGLNYYRLRQVDYDGQYEYHGPVTARFGNAGGVLEVFPTVTAGELTVSYQGQLDNDATLSIQSVPGRTLRQWAWDSKSGRRTAFSVADLPAGWYVLRLRSGREVVAGRFLKQ